MSHDKIVAADEYFERNELLQSNTGNTTLSIANRIYVHQKYPLNKTFKKVTTKKFSADFGSINFCDSKESARIINDFVEERTGKKIKDIMNPSSIDCFVPVVLINAIYFKGDWLHPFDAKRTAQGVFHVDNIDSIYVDFMRIRHYFTVIDLDELDARALELEYANSKLSFVIVLPNRISGLAALESKLKNYNLMKEFKRFDNGFRELFVVKIPKFKVEYQTNLVDIMRNVSLIRTNINLNLNAKQNKTIKSIKFDLDISVEHEGHV